MPNNHKPIFPKDQSAPHAAPSTEKDAAPLIQERSADDESAAAFHFLETLGARISLSTLGRSGTMHTRNYRLPAEKSLMLNVLKAVQDHEAQTNLYYVLNEPTDELQHDRRPKKTDIGCLRGVAVDVDPSETIEAEPGGFDRERKRLLALAADALKHPTCPPTVAVDSGNGVQLIWLFTEPMENTPETRIVVEAQSAGFAKHFGGDPAQSVEHLFRVPHTPNIPNAKKLQKLGFKFEVRRLI